MPHAALQPKIVSTTMRRGIRRSPCHFGSYGFLVGLGADSRTGVVVMDARVIARC
jgi:hypothetical protein